MEHVKITTPENIEIEYLLAGAGSRIAAGVIDLMIQSLFYAIIIIAMLVFNANYFIENDIYLSSISSFSWLIAIVILLFFLVYYLYFIVSEMMMNGQSIGKKIFGLRVIRDNGQPITLSQSLIRNLFRYFVDIYGIGVVSILFSDRCKRIGDMVASTIVINDSIKMKPVILTLQDITKDNNLPKQDIFSCRGIELSIDELTVLREFLNRRNDFIDYGIQCENKLNLYFQSKYNLSFNDVIKVVF